MRYNLPAIVRENRKAGGEWFSAATLSLFKTQLYPDAVFQGPGGVYFVSSDVDAYDNREYRVRQFNPETKRIQTANGPHPHFETAEFYAEQLSKRVNS